MMKKLLFVWVAVLAMLLSACVAKMPPEETKLPDPKDEVQTQPAEDKPVEPEKPAESEPSAYEQALALVEQNVNELYALIGQPNDSMYADSCLGEGEDGELYYDGFTVYTFRDLEGFEKIYDVMKSAD